MADKASLTAQGIAILRALESERPEDERLFCDPYACRFVSPFLLALTRFLVRTGYTEWRGPGVQPFLIARERFIDDYLKAGLAAGGEQVVILGAGYDARAYRFADRLEGARIFEVDHPATQRIKLQKLWSVFGRAPEHVSYVPVDFNQDALLPQLVVAGYAAAARTLFIWQGVTMYLKPEAVDETLDFIARHSASGSSVVFDYVYTSVVEGRVRRGEAAGMHRYERFTGEGLRFGIEEGAVEPYLIERGFSSVRNTTAADLESLYFSAGPRQGTRVAPVYAIATATVASGGLGGARQMMPGLSAPDCDDTGERKKVDSR